MSTMDMKQSSHSAHNMPGSQYAGDVVSEWKSAFENKQIMNSAKGSTDGPKAPVVPISPTAERNNPAFR